MINQPLSDAVKAILGDRLKTALGDVPGVKGIYADNIVGAVHAWHRISFDGWSPTLHPIRIHRESLHVASLMGRQRDAEELASDFIPVIDRIAARQHSRAANAVRLGHRAPLPKEEMSHVHIDTALPTLRAAWSQSTLREASKPSTRAAVLEAIRRAHAASANSDGRAAYQASGVLLCEHPRDDGSWMRCALPQVKIRLPNDDEGRLRRATMAGFNLSLPIGDIPETLATALIGRPVSALIRVHPAIDDRIIRLVTQNGAGVIVLSLHIDVDPIDQVAPAIQAAS